MRYLLDAIKFIIQLQRKSSDLDRYKTSLIIQEGVEVDLYQKDTTKNSPTIAIIHGMAPKGKDDPRLVHLAQSLAELGYKVVLPDIPPIRQLTVNTESLNLIKQFLLNWQQQTLPNERISLFSVSFSAGLSAIAAADDQFSDKVASICLIGGFANVYDAVEFLLGDEQADRYGALIMLKNFFQFAFPIHPELKKALDLSISDEINKTTKATTYLNTLSTEARNAFLKLTASTSHRLQWFNDNRVNMQEELNHLNAINHLKNLSAPVSLLHGATDVVIPASQSSIMHQQLLRQNISSKLVITPLLSHADLQYNLKFVNDALTAVGVLKHFFTHVNERQFITNQHNE